MSKVTLTGIGYWVNARKYKEWPGNDPNRPDKRWSMVLAPDEQSLAVIQELQMRGLKNRLKRNDQGEIVVSFSRPVEKLIKGAVRTFTPPVVYNQEGKVSDDLSIGNGSEVSVDLEVYEHNVPGSKNKSVAARWDGVKVLKLIEYNAPEKTVEEKPEQLW